MSKMKKYFTLFGLYIAQSIPMSFFSTAVPVIMREENYSLESIGLFQLVKLPWILKFLWAPLVDHTTRNLGQYKRWIVGAELFYAATILSVGFFNLQTNFTLIIILMLLAITASATQDIATDALAIRVLSHKERGTGNSVQSMGGFMGTVIGGGVLLLTYNYLGWHASLVGLSLFVLIALLPLWRFNHQLSPATKTSGISWTDIVGFFTQKGIRKQVVFLLICYSGLFGIQAMLKPFLVDLGYDMRQIGFMSNISGAAVAALCSFLAGIFIKRLGLRTAMKLSFVCLIIVPIYFYWLSLGHCPDVAVYAGVCLSWGIYGMIMVTVYTVSMNCVRNGYEGTDFTIQTVLTQVSGLFVAVISGAIAGRFGYSGLFLAEIGLATITISYVMLAYGKNNRAFALT